MIKTGPDDTDQLTTSVDCPRVWPLVVAPVPLLHALLHLSHVVGRQEQTLETTMSGHGTRRDEVVQQQRIQGAEHTPQTLNGLVDRLGRRIGHVGIVMSSLSVLDVVSRLELFEAISASIVNVLGIGNELGRRGRSVGSRHFEWRMG